MKFFALLLFVFPLSLFAQEKTFTGSLSLKGTDGDYMIGNRSMNFDSSTGTFKAELSEDLRTLSIQYDEGFKMKTQSNNFSIEFQAVQGEVLAAHEYKFASRYPFNSSIEAKQDYNGHVYEKTVTSNNGFSLSGNGRGCNTLSAEFEIKDIQYDEKTKALTKFEAEFKQYCDNVNHYATGTVKLQSATK